MRTPPMLDVLVIAPHPDDAELGMAGAIMKLQDEGAKSFVSSWNSLTGVIAAKRGALERTTAT